MELSSRNQEQLKTLLQQVQAAIAIAERAAIAQFQTRIIELAREVGVSQEQIVQQEKHRIGPRAIGKAPIRYQHPANLHWQWTGRGRTPRWVDAWVAEHGSRAGLLLSTNKENKDAP